MEPNTIYYGVHVPSDIQLQDSDGSRFVFFDKLEALKEVKKYKKARFKAFQFYHDALEFAQHGSECPNNNSTIEINSSMKHSESTQTVGERPSQFRGPKSQDLVKLRKAIEAGDLDLVRTTVWENPRYLISSGDTPAILQEGSRYNALHVAAKAKNPDMCELILSIVGSPQFIQLLYGEENRINSEEGSKILLDLYLNTPDKGLNETPLHFAVKFGSVEVVEILVSYPQCDKHVLNKYSLMPKDMICSRLNGPNEITIQKIASLLDDRYYVPVLRSEDNCIQPTIGEPFSPTSPPNLNKDPINPRMEIHAYAGPMKKDEASVFRKKWKTPPRNASRRNCDLFGSPISHNSVRMFSEGDVRLQDTEKGLERVGRDLAKVHNVGWKEYWPFLGTFTDLTTYEGLDQLESFLGNRYYTSMAQFSTNLVSKKAKMDTSINFSSNNISSIPNLSSNSIVSPMSELCKTFEAFSLSDNNCPKAESRPTKLESVIQNPRYNDVMDPHLKGGMTPYLCIEKSCQVFVHRIAHFIIYQMDTVTPQTLDTLEIEIKHLKSLISSFMDDPTFSPVNFQSVHSRIAYLISCKLKQVLIFDEELDDRTACLETVIQKYDKMVDLFSSDDEDLNSYRQPVKPIMSRRSTSDSKQVICVVEGILKSLDCVLENDFANVNTEEACIRAWANALPCTCVWKTNKLSRKGSFVKKSGLKIACKSPNSRSSVNKTLETVSRRLTFFEDDCGSNKGDGIDKSDNLKHADKLPNYFERHTTLDSSSSSDEEYMSANSTIVTSEDEDSFEDVQDDDIHVFIEGDAPTKVDEAVFNAIKDVYITSSDYPNIYRWKHSIKFYPEEERISWPSPSLGRYRVGVGVGVGVGPVISTPRADMKRSCFTPPHSWLRVTGQNSPLRSLKALKESVSLPYGQNCYYS